MGNLPIVRSDHQALCAVFDRPIYRMKAGVPMERRQAANPYGLQQIDIVKRETSVLSGVPRVRGASSGIVLHARYG